MESPLVVWYEGVSSSTVEVLLLTACREARSIVGVARGETW